MGSLYKSGRIRSYILIILIFISAVISIPVKNWFGKTVGEKIIAYNTLVNDKTGLSFTYESMSPSILYNFVIRGIKISNKDNDLVLSIDKAKLNLNLIELIKGDVQQGISNVTIDGLNIDLDELLSLINSLKTQVKQQKLTVNDIEKLIPQKTRVKNLQLSYSDQNYKVSTSVKSVSVSNDPKKSLLNLQLDANVKADLLAFKRNVSSKIDFSGVITYNLENSQANIRLSDLNDGNYHLNKLNLHLAYDNNKLQVHTIQSVNPVSLAADYNVKTSDVNIQLLSKKLSPFTVLNVLSKNKDFKALRKLTVDTDTIVKCNLNQKSLNFITDTNIKVPDEFFPGGFEMAFSFYGNENDCELTKFQIDGQNFEADAKLAYEYKTMKLSGFAELPTFVLKNNNIVSTEIYFEPLEKEGFMAFSPQLFIGSKALTALQLSFFPQSDSYDFAFEAYDYAHAMDSEPGLLQVEGSYLLKSKYVQANIGLNSIYFDSLADLTAQLVDSKVADGIQKYQDKLAPFMLSGDCYASTDLKSLSYNIPYVLIANTKRDNQVLMASFDGTEQSISLNQLSLVAGQYTLSASAALDRNPDSKDMFFSVNLTSGAIPYHFSGSIMPEVVNITGDYGTEIEVHFNNNKKIDGYMNLESIPFALGKNSLLFSTDAKFHYDQENGPELQMNRFEAELNDGDVSVNPKVVMSGNMTKYGAQINSIAYTDLYSALEGTADVMLNINDNIFDSVGLMVNLKNPMSDEGVIVDGSISNPDHLPFNKDTLLKSTYINLQAQLNSFGLNRFGFQQNDNNRITGTVYTSGTLEHPYFSLNVVDSAILFATDFLKVRGSIVLEDRDLTVSDLYVDFNMININDIQATASLENMSLDATGNLDCVFMDKTLFAPLKLSVSNAIIPEGKFIPDSLLISLSTTEFSGNLLKKKFPLEFSVMYSDKLFTIYSSENCGASGTYTTDGLLELTIDNNKFLKAKLDGLMNMKETALELYDVSVDMHQLFSYLNLDELLTIERGLLTGDILVTGDMDDPDINGFASISNPELRIPMLTNQKIIMDDINMSVVHNEIDIPKNVLTIKSGERIETDFKILLNKWSLNHIEGNLKTVNKDLFPIKMNNDMFSFNGGASFDLHIYFEDPVFDVDGRVFGENVNLTAYLPVISGLNTNSLQQEPKGNESPLMLRTDLDITLGTHASVDLDPLLRCVFVPNTSIKLKMDQSEGSYVVDGKLKLKSGDLAYLNRNFYIKSGEIKFNPDDISNPLITVSAETRERDDKNQNVKIVLSVDNQYLMDLKPRFTSVPAKSENEIRSILGQIVVADSNSAANFLFAASDYAIQSTVVRTAENKLRELFNFDIFSLRTNVLQNTLNMGVSGNLSKEKLSIGNFLDNSTVYIGKYLGSSLYVDAMLHVSFEDSYRNEITSMGSLLFQPEIGMELESPFANIRVNMVPDISALLNNQFVPSTSVTLSWKFSF